MLDFNSLLCYFENCVISLLPSSPVASRPTKPKSLILTELYYVVAKVKPEYGGKRRLLISTAIMPKLSIEDIRKRFEQSKEFNEIFDAFEQSLEQRFDDIELYKKLFWNPTLTPDELCLFGEKLAKEFPQVSYDTYMWLADIFEVTYSTYDNHVRSLEYFQKAAAVRPNEPTPYLAAAKCYEPDLNIPPLTLLIMFLKRGLDSAGDPKVLYERLIELYEHAGNDEMIDYYRRKLSEGSSPPEEQPGGQ